MEPPFNFQTILFSSSSFSLFFVFNFQKSCQDLFQFASEQISSETLSSLAFRENFKQILSSQTSQPASEHFSREKSSSLDSENFSSYFGARDFFCR